MKRISKFTDFSLNNLATSDVEIDYTLDESEGKGLSSFEQICLEEGIEFQEDQNLNEEYFEGSLDEIDRLDEGKFKEFLKKVGNKALGFAKNNFGTIVKTLGLSLAGPLGPIAGLLTQGIGGILSKIKLKPGEGIDKTQLSSAVSENPDLQKVGNVWTKTLQKLLDDSKKNPATFMTGDASTSIKNLAAIATAANQTIKSVSKEAKSTSKA
jgi:hypothetical protein